MIDIISIKNRLSELAIHGELVGHTGTLSDVEKIVTSIKRDRDSLIKEGLSKKSKESPMIEEDTFDLPDNWKWVALGDLCIFLSRGKSPKYSEFKKYPVFAQKCNQPDGLALWKAQFLDETTLEKWPEYFRLRDKDVVINSTGTGTMGRVGYYLQESLDSAYPFMLPDSHVTVARLGEGIISRYVYYAMRSPTLQMIMEKQFRGSTNQKEYYIDSVYATPIPLPPTDEQEKIADQLDIIFELLNSIDDFQKQYKSNQEALKNKLIDAAIQGKLTEQLPEDGTAEELYGQIQEIKQSLVKEGKIKKEKTLQEPSEDEIPFEIPENWRWVRISEVIDVRDGTHDSPKYHDEGIPLVTSKNISSGELSFDDVKLISADDARKINERSFVDDGDILFAMIGSIGNPVIVHKDRDFCIKNVALFKNFAPMHISMDYFYWFLMHEQYVLRKNAIGGLQPFVSLKVFRNHLMPLPPISEQIRIAERLYELMNTVSE